MSKKLNLESLTKKLRNVANTQDSIPMFSLWIIHHKVNYKQIVDTWLEILKSSAPKHRLTLLYLANDVIQCCKRKKAEVFKEYFAIILPEAISFLRDPSISSGVVRVLNIWTSRKVYDVELIDQLHAALLTNRPPDTLKQKLLAEYKPTSLIDAIAAFKKTEDALSIEEKQIRSINVDASSSDNIHKLKDKVGGERYSRNFEESATNIERFITQYEKFIEERKAIIDDLSQGAVFYRAQYHEAKIVVNAYQSFNTRVSKMKKLLDQVKLKFSPRTPPMDANLDSNLADMDMSDSDQELGSKPSKIVAVDTNTNRPTKSQNPPTSATNKPTQQTGTFVNRPGMRGASTSTMFSSASPLKTSSANINVPISFNGGTSADHGSKVSTPSGSPPSPEGSPELNISSPPRYPSLESRLADIFSTGSKPNLSSATENTGSESDNDSVPPRGEQSAASTASDSTQESTIPPKDTPASSASETQSSWQNTIPVIGGNRIATPNRGRSFMENLAALDGGSTPLQDEIASESEAYGNEKGTSNGVKPVEQVLPPPSFSGDALNFLTKFMGQQTNTSLPETTHTIASQEQLKPVNPLDSLNIDWNSIQSITASVGNRMQMSSTQGYDRTGSQNVSSTLPQTMRERDTDYRTSTTAVSFPPSSTVTTEQNVTKHSTDAADQFRDMLRRKSAEHPPTFAPSTEEVIVEEEEILVEDEGHAEQRSQQGHHFKYNKVHLNNLKNIPTAFGDNISPPPAPPPNNLLQLAGQKRHMEDEDFRLRNEFPPPRFPRSPTESRGNHFSQSPRVQQHMPRMPGGNRPPFRGSFSAHGAHAAEPFTHRPPVVRRNSAADFAQAENDYYDRLYDELRPKYPRPNMGRGQFRPRRPFR